VRAALDWLLADPAIELKRHTKLIETEPWGFRNQPTFVNAVAEIFTHLEPLDLLTLLKSAEKELGRKKSIVRWGPRVIDLDILLYGERIVETEDLTIPHPRLISRPFIIEQILELDDDVMHPKLRVPIRSFLKKKNT
jgi:2-amino-4-hydroxy-6-hydroxymethyldihydropteridine diphosphokinase